MLVKLETLEKQKIITVSKGKQLSKEDRDKGDFPVIGAGKKSPYNSIKTNFDGKSITISSSGAYAGYVWFHDYPFWASDCTILKVNKDELDIYYLYLFLLSQQSLIYSFQTGAGQPHVYWKNVKNIKIPLPPLPQQKTIAQTLDKAKELIALRKESIEKLDVLAKSLFVNMFGDPVENPMEWEVVKLETLLISNALNGYFGSKEDYIDEGTPTIWIGDFIDKYIIDINDLKRVKIPEEKKEKYLLKYGDILFCRSSLTKEGIAKVGFISKELNEEVIFEDHVIKVSVDTFKILPEYFYFYSYNQFYRLWMYQMSKTSTMTTIGQKEILKSPVILPPLPLQQKFAKIIQKIETQKALYEKELVKLEENFEALLAKSFA